jgi:hypothetical protein
VLALPREYPRLGKDKLVVLLRREDRRVSTSMVGRILADLQRRGVLHEPPRSAVLLRAHRKLRKRPWAIRKPKHWRIEQPGDLIEIDTKEIRMRGGVILKHFSRRDVISRWDVVELHRRGTSLAAARFLDTLLDRLPFAAKALQVDGGSEFAAEFEQACQQLNGHVERSHRTHNEEFYQVSRFQPHSHAQSPATTLGAHLQLRATAPGSRLPHSTRIHPPMETSPRKGKVSLIYWTSTTPISCWCTTAKIKGYAEPNCGL